MAILKKRSVLCELVCSVDALCTALVHNGVMAAKEKTVRQSVTLPAILRSRSPWPSAYLLRRMSSAGLSQPTTIRLQTVADLPGSPSSVKRKTAFTASICSDVNRWLCGHTGCWSSWISTLGGSSDSGFTLASWMAGHSVGCLIERFDGKRCRDI